MTLENMVVGQIVPLLPPTPLDAGGKPTNGLVKTSVYTSADTTLLTVAVDPSGNSTITAVAAGTVSLTSVNTGTDPDGTPFTVPGSATVVIAAKANPTVAVQINFGPPIAPPAPPAVAHT